MLYKKSKFQTDLVSILGELYDDAFLHITEDKIKEVKQLTSKLLTLIKEHGDA